jgi:hypothetical protein
LKPFVAWPQRGGCHAGARRAAGDPLQTLRRTGGISSTRSNARGRRCAESLLRSDVWSDRYRWRDRVATGAELPGSLRRSPIFTLRGCWGLGLEHRATLHTSQQGRIRRDANGDDDVVHHFGAVGLLCLLGVWITRRSPDAGFAVESCERLLLGGQGASVRHGNALECNTVKGLWLVCLLVSHSLNFW